METLLTESPNYAAESGQTVGSAKTTATRCLPGSAQSSPSEARVTRASPRVACEGKFLRVNGRRFWIKGVTYGTFARNAEGEPYPPIDVVRHDFEQMRAVGVNTVRLYTPPSDRMADAAANLGLYLIPDVCWGPRRCQLDAAEEKTAMREWLRGHARRLGGHPAILMYSLGNEIPPLVVRWYGRRRIHDWIRELYDLAKEAAPHTLVTYVNHPPTEHLELPFLDVVSWNIYLEREREFRGYLGRLQMLAGDRPVFLAELGLDSRRHGETAQAQFLTQQLRAVFEKGLCGAAVYSWTDDWQIFNSQIEGWSFGLTNTLRRPKPSLQAVRLIYSRDPRECHQRPLPSVSVIVCARNAGATIDECLQSLTRLHYPDYEVIVVDDGSCDDTAERAKAQGVRLIQACHGGLSRARNLGIEAARGEIVAFIDADAYADVDWLYFLVTRLEDQEAVGVGGPNLPPPHDGFTARCIHHAPGNPTHVLLDDERAEHVPGCNMAFRRSALERIGRFDVTHRAAGDDVDVCWKLLAREETIAFSPVALVWHHRRSTVAGYLRQQRGYGRAEAHLHWRYPGHYNLFGYPVWQGGIYDSERHSLRWLELPLGRRSQIYQGRFGGAQFQAVYPAFRPHCLQLFTTVEWMAASLSLAGAGWLGRCQSGWVGAGLLAATLGGMLLTLAAAALAGCHAAKTEHWRGLRWLRGAVLVAGLHLAQPIARVWGRWRGWFGLLGQDSPYCPEQRLYGNLAQREEWLHRLERHVSRFGWRVRPSSDFAGADLDILGPGPFAAQLQSVYEENLERAQHYVRYRVTARWRPKTFGYLLLAGSGLVAALTPLLWPLAALLAVFLVLIVRTYWILPRAISQMAVEVGEGLGMAPVRETSV